MNRRELAHIGTLVLAGFAIRAWLFMDVGVNGDTGLYLYDAKQILWGHRIFIDFPSRSPVFEYALAGVLSLGYSPILSGRAFMVAIGLALGVAIYALARQLHSHRAGLAAAALFYLTPFPAVWGLWVKTEQAAGLLLVAAFILALTVLDRDRLPAWAIGSIGVLFGLAFLVRRVAIVHIGAFAIFIAYYRLRHAREWRSTLTAAAGVIGVALLTLLTVYAGLAGFDPGLTLSVADTHAVALFESGGQGSLGWIEVTEPRPATAEDRTNVIAELCQKCGSNTVTVFLVTLLLVLPVLLPLVAFLRSYFEPAGFIGRVAPPAIFGVTGMVGLVNLIGTPYWTRALAVVVILGAVALAWSVDAVPWSKLWRPQYGLLVVVLASLTAGYLYRDRILYVTYFQDFYPYLVTLAGITAVEFYDHSATLDRRGAVRIATAALLVLSMAVGVANAYPYNPDMGEPDRAWLSIEMVQEHGDDIEARTEPGDRVLTAQPLYVIETDRRLVADLSRHFYLFRGWPGSSITNRVERDIVRQVRDDRTTHVILDSELQIVYNATDRIEPAVECRFERAGGQQLYKRTDAVLLQRTADATC